MPQVSAGRVLNMTAGGELLLAAPPALAAKEALGRPLVDARLEPVARVADVIGPVSAPWIVAVPKPGVAAHRLVGRDLHLGSPTRGPQARRRRGGR